MREPVTFAGMTGHLRRNTQWEQFGVHANQITGWKNQLLKQADGVFLTEAERKAAESGLSAKDLRAKIGRRPWRLIF